MFHKLRLKLTLINVAIIVILFFILIVGSYFFAQRELTSRSEMMANKIMADLESGVLQDLRLRHDGPPGGPPHPPGPDFFFIKTDAAGAPTFLSSNIKLDSEAINILATTALLSKTPRGIAEYADNDYPYLKSAVGNNTIILFQDYTRETRMLRSLLTALIITGLICLALSFYGSFFMANRAMSPISKAWQQQVDFISDASHELRTPLTVIQTNLEIVMGSQHETVASQIKWLHNIQEESFHMAQLVDTLLFLARSDANQQLLINRPFSLTDAIYCAALPFEAVAKTKKLTFNINTNHAITANGDETRIKQVVGILLDNAIRHTSEGGRISLCLSKANSNNSTLLTVTDTGEGIPPEHLEKIFDRFYQADKSRSNGSGLGLAIAKSIIESHNGKIKVDSTPGFGTTFTIMLPWQ